MNYKFYIFAMHMVPFEVTHPSNSVYYLVYNIQLHGKKPAAVKSSNLDNFKGIHKNLKF
jgi:hypothetical protein